MARSHHRLSIEIQQTITAFIRAGGFPQVAAEAAGIAPRLFERWLSHGRRPQAAQRFRDFYESVQQARAQARLRAETAVFKNRPLDWLRSGPARESAGNPGWTASARPAPPAGPRGSNPLLQAEVQDAIATILQLLTPFPEARSVVAEAFARRAGT